jgi:hypothetical protein
VIVAEVCAACFGCLAVIVVTSLTLQRAWRRQEQETERLADLDRPALTEILYGKDGDPHDRD